MGRQRVHSSHGPSSMCPCCSSGYFAQESSSAELFFLFCRRGTVSLRFHVVVEVVVVVNLFFCSR